MIPDGPVALRETGVSRRHPGGNGAPSPIVGDGTGPACGITVADRRSTRLRATLPHPAVTLLAVGNELLDGRTREGNAGVLGALLAAQSVSVRAIVLLPDRIERIVASIGAALAHGSGVILSGGLGPTFDDLTRSAVARALGVGLVLSGDALVRIRERFRRLGRQPPESNLRQALFPKGARRLVNDHGTADGFLVWTRGLPVASLPGVPGEFQAMVPALCERLAAWLGVGRRRVATICARDVSESVLGEWVEQLGLPPGFERAICAGSGEIRVTIAGPAGHTGWADVRMRLERGIDRLSLAVLSVTPPWEKTSAVGLQVLPESAGVRSVTG